MRETATRDNLGLHSESRVSLGTSDCEATARLLTIGVSMGLIRVPSRPMELTAHGQAFAGAIHWRLWRVPDVLRERFKDLEIEASFLGGESWEERAGVIDLFGGAGGFSLAFESAGFAVRATVDNDPIACTAFARNFPYCNVVAKDVNDLASKSRTALQASLGQEFDGIAGVIGSPPCQGFSNIGEKLRDDPRNELAHRFIDVVLKIHPLFFVLENVPTLQLFGTRPSFETFLMRLNRASGAQALAIINTLPTPDDSKASRTIQARKRLLSHCIQEARDVIDASLLSVEECGNLGKISAIGVRAISESILSALPQAYSNDLIPVVRSCLPKCKIALATIAISLSAESLIHRKVLSGKDCLSLVEDLACQVEGNIHIRTAAEGIIREYASLPEPEEYRGMSIGPSLSRLIVQASEKYDVNRPVVLNSAHYGAPQNRQRLFLIGVRKDFLGGKDRDSHRREFWDIWSKCLNRNLAPASTAADALGDLPNVDDYQDLKDSDFLRADQLARIRSNLAAILRLDEQDYSDQSLPRLDWNPYWLDGCKRTIHSKSVIKRLKTIGEGKRDKTSRRSRLHRNFPSQTLRAGTLQDKGSHTAVRPIHFEHDRVITVREGARLMGYPDWMTFHGTNWHGSRLVGNGVPIKLGYAIAASIRDSLFSRRLEDSGSS